MELTRVTDDIQSSAEVEPEEQQERSPGHSETFAAGATAVSVAGMAGCAAVAKYRSRHPWNQQRGRGRDGDPGVRNLMAGVARCLDALPESLGTRFGALVAERVLKDTREGEPSAAVSILVGILGCRHQAAQQVAADALTEALCGLPARTEVTTINRETMRRAGAGAALVPLLTSASEPLRKAAYSIVAWFVRDGAPYRISREGATAHQLYAAGAIPPVVAALDSSTIFFQSVALHVVNWIARIETGQALQEAGVVPKLVGLLSSPSPDVRQFAAAALSSVAGPRPDTVAGIVSEGAVPRLVSMLASDPEDQAMMQAALLAIESLCSNMENLQMFAHEGAIPPLVTLVGSPRSCNSIRGAAAAFIQGLASDEIGERDAVVRGGAVGALVAGLQACECEAVRHSVLGAMANISCSADTRDEFVEAGALPQLAGMLEARSEQEQLLAAMTLGNLAYMGLPTAAVEEVDLIPRLIRLLGPGCNPDLSAKAAATLANLGKHGMGSADAVSPLLHLLAATDKVQQHAAIALRCCSYKDSAFQARIVEAGGVSQLLGVMCDSDWSDTCEYAAATLMNCSMWPDSRPVFQAAFANMVIVHRTS